MSKSFGEILKEAREAKGLSTSQVASRTHILVKIIEALEMEDFRKIPAPIYGRGFVRLYCECVGIDSKPLITEYMQIHSGEKTPLYIRMKNKPADESPYVNEVPVFSTPPETPVQPASAETVNMETTPSAKLPADEAPVVQVEETPKQEDAFSSTSGLELFDRPQKIDPFPSQNTKLPTQSSMQAPSAADYDSPFISNRPDPTSYMPTGPSVAERFKNSISVFSNQIIKNVHNIPRRTWRIFALAGGIVLILVFIGWIISKLYQVTSTPATAETPVSEVKKDTTVKKEVEDDVRKDTKNDVKKDAITDIKKSSSGSDKVAPAKRRGKLKSSGLPVPALYVD